MNSKERFDFMTTTLGHVYKTTAEDLIMCLVNELIAALYIPCKGERQYHVDEDRCHHFKVDRGEPINWGDLKCNEAKKFEDGSFLVVIDEAAPNDCQSLCEYIETYMKSYGWDVRVQTEW
jgi:hypothetical protein